MKEQALGGLVDDPDTSEEEESGFDEGGEIFYFTVTVLVIGIGRLVGNTDREIGDDGGDEVESRVGRFGKNSQAAGSDADHDFESGDGDGGEDGVAGDSPFVLAHVFGRVGDGGIRHVGIIAAHCDASKDESWARRQRERWNMVC